MEGFIDIGGTIILNTPQGKGFMSYSGVVILETAAASTNSFVIDDDAVTALAMELSIDY